MSELIPAKRYAHALLQLAASEGIVPQVEEQLRAFADLYEQDESLRTLLEHPRIPLDRKRVVLGELVSEKFVRPLVETFYFILEKGRIRLLPALAQVFRELADRAGRILRVEVSSFLPLDESQQRALEEKLVRLTEGHRIELSVTEDRSLLGGLVVRIGNTVIDGSLAGRWKLLREELLESTRK